VGRFQSYINLICRKLVDMQPISSYTFCGSTKDKFHIGMGSHHGLHRCKNVFYVFYNSLKNMYFYVFGSFDVFMHV